ncbi:MAG: hypothetical protein QXF14_01925, partial [Candidatus Woesearchaeota archaeon]
TSGLYYVIICDKKINWKLARQIVDELNKKGFALIKHTSGNYDTGLGIINNKLGKVKSTTYTTTHYGKYMTLLFDYTNNIIWLRVAPPPFEEEKFPELKQIIDNLIATMTRLASETVGIKLTQRDWI